MDIVKRSESTTRPAASAGAMTAGDQIRPRGEIEKQLRDGPDRVLRIQHRLPRDLAGPRAPRLPDHDRVHPALAHPVGQRLRQRGLARAFGPLENDEEPATAHPSVMMLLAAPFSMPSLIC